MIGPTIAFHRFNDQSGCVLRRECASLLPHSFESRTIAKQIPDQTREHIVDYFGFLQEHSRLAPGKNLGVARLMIIGCVRKRDKDGRKREDGQL